MGHMVGKELYERLGDKIDKQHMRAPMNATFYEMLKELYSPEEAEVVAKMPYLFSSLDRVSVVTRMEKARLRKILDSLCAKGLIMDIHLEGEYRYMPSPFIIGLFEFTMMRTDGQLDRKKCSTLFHEYLEEGSFYRANFSKGEQISFARALPHEEALEDHVEILDYERASRLVEAESKYAVGLCSCRHKKDHAGIPRCDTPLRTCTTFGQAADYLIRHKMCEEISKTEANEILAHSKELGLVFSCDNVQKRIMFICSCCGCCCGILTGINKHGLTATLVTSSFVAKVDEDKCIGCGLCAQACHVKAIQMNPAQSAKHPKKKKEPRIDPSFCLGCGVCALKCKTGALKLVNSQKRIIRPEDTFERVILQCLERGTLENQMFDDPQSITHKALRGIVGGFLRLSPVKKALMSDALRSTFLHSMRLGIKALGKGYVEQL